MWWGITRGFTIIQTIPTISSIRKIAEELRPSQFVSVYTALDNNWLIAGSWIQFKHDDTIRDGQIEAIHKTNSVIELKLTNTDILIVDRPNQTCYYKTNNAPCTLVNIKNPMNHPLDHARIAALRANIEPLSVTDKRTLLNTQYNAKLPIDPWLLQIVVNADLCDDTAMKDLMPIICHFLHTCRIHVTRIPYPSPSTPVNGWILITHGHNQNNQHFDTLWALALHVIEKPASTDFRTACQIETHAPDPNDAIAHIIARGYTVEPNNQVDAIRDPDAKQAPREWEWITSL